MYIFLRFWKRGRWQGNLNDTHNKHNEMGNPWVPEHYTLLCCELKKYLAYLPSKNYKSDYKNQ